MLYHHCFSTLFWNMPSEGSKEGLELNVTHQLLAHADDVIILRRNINTIRKNIEALLDAVNEVGLEANLKKTKYTFMST
jgi:hypothetical protein